MYSQQLMHFANGEMSKFAIRNRPVRPKTPNLVGPLTRTLAAFDLAKLKPVSV